MKKFVAWMISGLILVLFLNYFAFISYNREVNIYLSGLVNEIEKYYPNVHEEDIVKLLNAKNSSSSDTLKRYGFINDNTSYLKKINQVQEKYIIISVSVFFAFNLTWLFMYFCERKKRKQELIYMTDYLKKINMGLYDLEIVNNDEGELSILKNEIYKTTINLKEMYAKEYDERIKIKDNLANISHQLKTPLTSIMLMADTLIEEDVDKDKQKDFLKDIRSLTENINFLVIAILKLSKFDANVLLFNKDLINVSFLMKKSLENIKLEKSKKNVDVNLSIDESAYFYGDFNWECEAFTNILKNAIECNEENIKIDISARNIGNFLIIEIKDNGIGIPPHDRKHIFERFYKRDNSTSNNFGIGLSLAKEIINKDGGTIRLLDAKKGAAFKIKFYTKNN